MGRHHHRRSREGDHHRSRSSHSRRRHRSRSSKHHRTGSKHKRSRSGSYSSSRGYSSDSSHRHKRNRKKKQKSSKDDRRHRERQEREREAKLKQEEMDRHHPSRMEYGKYGIIKESDQFFKQDEFRQWVIDVRKIDYGCLPNGELKKLFRDYMEDYNTATMPHEKYYDLEGWERKERLKQYELAKTGLGKKKERSANDFNDDAELAAKRKEERERRNRAIRSEEKRERFYNAAHKEKESMISILRATVKK